MFTIELAEFGLKLHTEGVLSVEDATEWGALYTLRLKEAVARGRPFGQVVDLRGFKPMAEGAQAIVDKAMKEFKALGGQRSAVIFDSAVAAMQIRRLAQESGIYAWERYLDVESHPNFEQLAVEWVADGKDPDA